MSGVRGASGARGASGVRRGGRWLKLSDRAIERLLMVVALTSIAALLLITVFIFAGGLPVLVRTRVVGLVAGLRWAPTHGSFGILPMLLGSLLVTGGALAVGVPLSLLCAVFLSEVAPARVARLVKPAIEVLAGIPSVIYGFIGLIVLVPLIRTCLGGPGFSVLAASVVLGVMILPTLTSISYDALRAVPDSYRDGAAALGATNAQAIRRVLLPAARRGIVVAMILGLGRALGETMAVIMVAGNAAMIPSSLLDPVRTLTTSIALELGYASGLHRDALFATGAVLFVMIMLLSLLAGFRPTRARR